jgi:hypothetical protein
MEGVTIVVVFVWGVGLQTIFLVGYQQAAATSAQVEEQMRTIMPSCKTGISNQ